MYCHFLNIICRYYCCHLFLNIKLLVPLLFICFVLFTYIERNRIKFHCICV